VNAGARFPDVSLSVVMPAYNEAANIEATVPRAIASLRAMVGAFELILIDDCSKDATPALARALAARFPEIRFEQNPENLRQGGTLRRGFAMARHDWITHNAMDYPFDFDGLPALLVHAVDADVIVASRKTYPGTTPARRFVSFANRALLRGLFGARVHDYNFIQIYRRAVVQDQPSFSTATSFITAEKIIRATHAGLRVVEVPVDYLPRLAGTPSSANWRNIRAALRDMARLWLELRRGG
jgi:glycosyltransferase involved in cell wall biosynthesis